MNFFLFLYNNGPRISSLSLSRPFTLYNKTSFCEVIPFIFSIFYSARFYVKFVEYVLCNPSTYCVDKWFYICRYQMVLANRYIFFSISANLVKFHLIPSEVKLHSLHTQTQAIGTCQTNMQSH